MKRIVYNAFGFLVLGGLLVLLSGAAAEPFTLAELSGDPIRVNSLR